MAYIATPEDIQKIRYELNDNSPGLYILDDSTISYYLEKNQGSIARTTIDCARAILFRLSMDSTEEIIDVLSIKNRSVALSYKESLELFLRNPDLNPIMRSVNPYAGGISKSDIATNLADTDQNTVVPPDKTKDDYVYNDSSNPFLI